MRIGLLSDTHGYLDPKILIHFKDCDEIWHAGDFGTLDVSDQLSAAKILKGVHGNIDGKEIRLIHPEEQVFFCEKVKVYVTHVGGYPGNYFPEAKKKIVNEKPGLFICGHSHILKVVHDKKYDLLHMNPGAAGKHGFHKVRTILRFTISADKITDLEAIELGLRSQID
jgi:putative phosphoesterase